MDCSTMVVRTEEQSHQGPATCMNWLPIISATWSRLKFQRVSIILAWLGHTPSPWVGKTRIEHGDWQLKPDCIQVG